MKFHISDSGEIVECKASKNECPKQNFESIAEAEQFLQAHNTPTVSKTHKNPLKRAEQYYGGEFVAPHKIALSKGVEKVLKDLYKIGNPLIVGGAVRDSFTNAENKDIDIEVHKTDIDELTEHLKKNGYRVDEVGKQFGVLKVSKKGVVNDLDISVPRQENRLAAGHRSFEISMDKNMTVQEAAERRDFTFNAVMYDHRRSVLVDPAHGQKDFNNRVMRHVSEKFAEDPLRVLRGFQFAGRFNMTMAEETIQLSQQLREEYVHLSTERIQEEWGKFFTKSTVPSQGVRVLQETGWDDTEPELRETLSKEYLVKALDNLPNVPQDRKVIYGAAAIVSGMRNDGSRENFLSKSVIGTKEQRQAYNLATIDKDSIATTYQRKKIAKELEKSGFTFRDYGNFSKMMNDEKGAELAKLAEKEGIADSSEPDLIMGKDLMKLSNRKPGPWMGELLTQAREHQYQGVITTKEEAIEFIKEHLNDLS